VQNCFCKNEGVVSEESVEASFVAKSDLVTNENLPVKILSLNLHIVAFYCIPMMQIQSCIVAVAGRAGEGSGARAGLPCTGTGIAG